MTGEKGIRAALDSKQRWHHDQLRHQVGKGQIGAELRLARFEQSAERRQLSRPDAWQTMTPEQKQRATRDARRARGTVGQGKFALPALQAIDAGGESRSLTREPLERFDAKQINASVDMKQLVSRYGLVPNHEGKCACPAHSGGRTRATLHVYRDHVHCYHSGCGYTADPIRWVQDREGVDFVDACRILSGQAPRRQTERPVTFEVKDLGPSEPEVAITPRPLAPLALAAQSALWAAETPLAVQAMEYLLSRGFEGDELMTMGVGVIDKTVPDELLPLNRHGTASQMWRSRITIPGWVDGECVSIKGRTLLPEPEDNSDGRWRKYVNTAGNSTRPFGWDQELEEDGDEVIITEGELDLWTFKHLLPGIPVIAVPGLGNLSLDYAQRLAGRKVLLLIDGDTHVHDTTAGALKDATDEELKQHFEHSGPVIGGRRLARKLLDAGADVWVCSTGAEGDLNDLMNQQGRENAIDTILSALNDARPLRTRRRLI